MELVRGISLRVRNYIRSRIQKFGWAGLKGWLWDREFTKGRWDFIESTPGDPVYLCLEMHCKQGSILDLGCGSGNTGVELDVKAYQDYTGVDISEIALNKARQKSVEVKRVGRNRYFQSDILTYVPDRLYDVILFRESIYYIPESRIKGMLDRYSHYLKRGGVFIVRRHDNGFDQGVEVVGAGYAVLERHLLSPVGPVIFVFNKK